MPRIPRNRLGRGVFHVINRGLDRRWIFNTVEDKRWFIDELVNQRKKYQLTIYHWVVMSNHFHLAVEALKISDLSAYIGKVSERYTKYIHKKYGGGGPLWQGRYKSKVVQKEGYLSRLGRYIERNPIRANLNLKYPWDSKWSSASCYVNNSSDPLVNRIHHPNWNSMGLTDKDRSNTYRKFLLTEKESFEDEELFHNQSSAIGDKDFKSDIKESMGRLIARKPGRRLKKRV